MNRTWRMAAVLAGFTGVALAGTALALAAALQSEPTVAQSTEVDHNDVAKAIALARAHDPRYRIPGLVRTAGLSERDLGVLINHIGHRWVAAPTRISLERGAARVDLSLQLPANPFGRWLNVHAQLRETSGLPALDAFSIGRLPLPTAIVLPLLQRALETAGLAGEVRLATEVVRGVQFLPQHVELSYAWRDDSAERVKSTLVSADEQQRLRAYSDCLVELAAQPEAALDSSLARWMGPLFALARQRSEAGGDAAAENRAALVVLTMYANGRGLETLLPAARDWPRARPLRLTLAGRDDSPLHLLISAAVATEGTSPLSRAVGLYKEVADSRGGSGFSFNDLAADRAGTRLGEMATQQPQRLQAALARGVREADFMPLAADLPEGMPEHEFKRRFGGVGAPAYTAMVAEIDRRVSALPALQ